MKTLELRLLEIGDETSFTSAVREFEMESPPWAFAFDFDENGCFAEYVSKLEGWTRGEGVREGFVSNSYFVGIVEGKVVGRLSIRHELNDFLRNYGGHIGYGVVPSERRKGYASEMLRQSLPFCTELGIERALISCDVDGVASRKVIEKNGGVFDSTTTLPELDLQKELYWIECRSKRGN
tara:strand:+ start:190 stop:729 length:540 start_codon:yes stop_codon:yes gene_type:complete